MADSTLPFIVDVNDPQQDGLFAYFLPAIAINRTADLVRNDRVLAYTIRPVVASITSDRPFDDDYVDGDEFILAIGLQDDPPIGGTFGLNVNGVTTGLTDLAYNISASDLQTALSAASVTAGYGALTVTSATPGVYRVRWSTTGARALITGDDSGLLPVCDVVAKRTVTGDGSTREVQVILLRQALVAISVPATPLPGVDVIRSEDQAASSTTDPIVRISPGDGGIPYGGVFMVEIIAGGISAQCGNIKANASAQEFGLVLANHPAIYYQDETQPDNIIVSKDGWDFIVQFTGTIGGPALYKTINAATVANPSVLTTTAAHNYRTGDTVVITGSTGTTPSLNGTYAITVLSATTFSIPLNVTASSSPSATVFNTTESTLAVTNVSLLVPKGLSGTIDLNTINLFEKFASTSSDELTFTCEIERTRASGEVRTILSTDIVLKRDIIDEATMVPLPTFDALYSGNATVTAGQDYVDVTFSGVFASSAWEFLTPPHLVSSVHPPAEALFAGTVSNKTTTGYRVYLSGAPANTQQSIRSKATL